MTTARRSPRCVGSGAVVGSTVPYPGEGTQPGVTDCPECGRPVRAQALGAGVVVTLPSHGTVQTAGTRYHDDLLRAQRTWTT